MSLDIQNSIEKTKNFLGKYKTLLAASSLALLLNISDINEEKKRSEQMMAKNIGEFSYVERNKERNIYKYKIKQGDCILDIADKFNELDFKKGNLFKQTGTKNILINQKGEEIDPTTKLKPGQTIYIKAKLLEPKKSDYTYTFQEPENKEYRKKNEKSEIQGTQKEISLNKKEKTIKIIKDGALNFYVVQPDDFFPHKVKAHGEIIKRCINFQKIIQKLSQLEEFEYLKDEYYHRSSLNKKTKELTLKNKLYSFNINAKDIEKNFTKEDIKNEKVLLPIPFQKEKRVMDIKSFAYYAQQGIQEMKDDKKYNLYMKELLASATPEEILEAVLTYAYCESSTVKRETLGNGELHRREGAYKAFSYSFFHILMGKNTAGLEARINLGLTEGECYHPKNATKLFLAYWIEKCKKTGKNIEEFFPLREENYEECARRYNGGNYKDNDYDTKLRINQEKVIRLLKESKN